MTNVSPVDVIVGVAVPVVVALFWLVVVLATSGEAQDQPLVED